MNSLFGTDGIRGIVGKPPLTPQTVRRLALASARVFLERGAGRPFANGTPPQVILGRDTRGSGPALARWLQQGLARAGCLVLDAGVIPTPAVAYLAPRHKALFGVVISASHNPPEFNGIKFFTAQGFKAPVDLEAEIESRIASCRDPGELAHKTLKPAGLAQEYLEFLRSTFPATCDLSGMRIVVDAANGAAYHLAPRLLKGLGAEVFAIGCHPNGSNINKGCGALDTQAMRREVKRRRADCGVAFDGDADRAIFADERARLMDGDVLIAMAATRLKACGLLRGNTVVLTVMANFGLIRYLENQGIRTVQVPVGDRNVTDALESGGYALGGESSGHIVFRGLSCTGDGLLTCMQILALSAQSRESLSRFRLYRSYPQVLSNVHAESRVPLEELREFGRCLRQARHRLKGIGRVFVRYSGTEPVLRILVEGPDAGAIRRISRQLVGAFKEEMKSYPGMKK